MIGIHIPKFKDMRKAKLMVSNSPTRHFKGDHQTRTM
jgi:hypothetical protein